MSYSLDMKKGIFVLSVLFAVISFSFVSALSSQNNEVSNIVISEIGNPVEFDLTIDSEGVNENVYLSSTLDLKLEPNNFSDFSGRETFRITAYLPENVVKLAGNYNIEYVVNGDKSQAVKDSFRVRVIGLDKALELSPITIELADTDASLVIKNKINQSISNLEFRAESAFFNERISLDLEPFEEKRVNIKIDSEKAKENIFGSYTAQLFVGDSRDYIETNVNYLEKEDSELSKDASGFIVRKTTYTKTNTGNVPIVGEIEMSKDVFSRLFTITSVEPESKDRGALSVKYVWSQDLAPGESFSVTSTTNYTFPVILLLIIVIVALVVRMYLRTNLVIDKRVSYVKTRGGEFALKVTLHVKAKKYIENVQIVDRLPGMTQLYERFGIKPTKIDPASRRLFWDVERLNAGEERIYSYVIFSKVSVVGRFELPAASAMYQRDGKTEQTISNRTFFVADTLGKAE